MPLQRSSSSKSAAAPAISAACSCCKQGQHPCSAGLWRVARVRVDTLLAAEYSLFKQGNSQIIRATPSPCAYVCVHRYQQVAKATFDVQAKQQYLKQLEAEADRLKAAPGSVPAPTPMQPQPQQPTAQQPQQHQRQHLGAHPSQSQQQQQGQSIAAGLQPSIPPSAATAAGGAAAVAGQGGGMMRVLEGTAQEVYRALLFVVFTIEVYVMSLVPFAGGLHAQAPAPSAAATATSILPDAAGPARGPVVA